MSHQAVSSFCCLSLLLSLTATACKTAPDKPEFNAGYATVAIDPIDLELAQLEAERAEAIQERDRLTNLYSKGANPGKNFDYQSYAAELDAAAKDDELKSYSKEGQDNGWWKGDKAHCGGWLKKIIEHIKNKRVHVETKIEVIEGKIRDCHARKCKDGCNGGWEPGKGGGEPGKGGWEPGKGGWEPGKGGWEPGKGGDTDSREPLPPPPPPPPPGGKDPGQNIPNQNDPFPKGK